MIGDYLDQYTYAYLLAQALARVPDDVDKREGSIIYDALAPACYELAEFYINLKQVLQQSYASLATGEYLDARVAEQGMTRIAATYAVMDAVFIDDSGMGMILPMGTRFRTISDEYDFIYEITGIVEPFDAHYQLTCETLGEDGNFYRGNLMPIDYIAGLETAQITDIISPGRDTETDEELRERYFEAIESRPFGGNVAQYQQEIKLLEVVGGIGGVQVHPVWDGGGTVKVSVINSDYEPIDAEILADLKELIDPYPYGTGLGIAPIGHEVTVVTPEEVPINLTVTITRDSTHIPSDEQAQTIIAAAFEDYLLSLKQDWDNGSSQNNYYFRIYRAKILAMIIAIPGVTNVTAVFLNGVSGDIDLIENGTTQQIPTVGTVTVVVDIPIF